MYQKPYNPSYRKPYYKKRYYKKYSTKNNQEQAIKSAMLRQLETKFCQSAIANQQVSYTGFYS